MSKSLFSGALVIVYMCIAVVDAGAALDGAAHLTMPLETGSKLSLLCIVDNVTQPGVEILHEGEPLCNGCGDIRGDITVTGDIRITYSEFQPGSFIIFIIFDNLTVADSGEYTCRTSTSNSASFELRVAEMTCDSGEEGRLEYTVGESLELRCFNPFPRSAVWLDDGGSMLSSWTWRLSPDVNLTQASVSLGLDDDLASFECSLEADSSQGTLPKSCIIGPIRVSPFIEITSSVGNEIATSTESVTLTCRMHPENNDTIYQWEFSLWSESADKWNWNISDETSVESTLTIYNLSLTSNDVINVTCEGVFQNWNLTADYDISVVGSFDVFLIIIIVSSSVALLVVVATLLCLCCCIVKRCQRKTLVIADRYPTIRVDSEKSESNKPSGVILNRYDRDPTEFAADDLTDEEKSSTILTQLPDGRLQLKERKMSTDTVLSHGSTFSDVSHRSMETSIHGDIYDEPPNRAAEADSSSLQEIYDEPPTRDSIHRDADDIPRPVSILLPDEHSTPSFRVAAKDRPVPMLGRINRAFSRSTDDEEEEYHDVSELRAGKQYYEEPIYSAVNKQNRTLVAIDVSEDDDIQDNQESFYDECDDEEGGDYDAIRS